MLIAIRSLGNRSFGFILGFLVVLNLACGSLVMNFHPDLYPRFALLDFGFFMSPPRPVHFWFYLLILVVSLFGLNITVCTVEAFFRLLKIKVNRRRQFAALLCHLAIMAALVAHLYEGLSGSGQQVMIGSVSQDLPGIGRVRAESVTKSTHPDGSLKDTEAVIAVQFADGKTTKRKFSYNSPAIFNSGKDQVIILSGDKKPTGLVLVDPSTKMQYKLMPSTPVPLTGGFLILNRIFMARRNIPFAQITWHPRNQPGQRHYLALDHKFKGHNQVAVGHNVYVFEKIIEEATVYTMVRHNPSIPLMAVSMLLLGIGTILLVPIRFS